MSFEWWLQKLLGYLTQIETNGEVKKKMYFKYYVGDTTVPRLYVCHISGSKSICILYMFRLTIQIGAKLQNKTDLKDIYCL